jgi:hypothetical protein
MVMDFYKFFLDPKRGHELGIRPIERTLKLGFEG